MAQMEQGSNGLGNTKPSRARARKWGLTLNNYTDEEVETLKRYCNGHQWVIGFEKGEKKETPHIHVYIKSKKLLEFSTLQKLITRDGKCAGHWEQIRDEKSWVNYCIEDGNFISGGGLFQPTKKDIILAKTYTLIEWKPWQQEVIDIAESEEDTRSIYWIFEEDGNSGKSFLYKYLWAKYDCCLASGKRGDVLYSINQYMTKTKKEPKLILLDIPRSIESQFISYTCLEELKNGLFLSGKYESEEGAFIDIPHIIVFSNREPEYHKMSADRWKVKRITPDNLLIDVRRLTC